MDITYPKDKAMVPHRVQGLVLGVCLLIVELEPSLAKAVNEVAESIGVLASPAKEVHGLGNMDLESSSIPAERQLQSARRLTLVLLLDHDLVRLGSSLQFKVAGSRKIF